MVSSTHPIHAKARKFINLAVIILLFCLFYLFTAPIQSSIGIPTFGTGKGKIGTARLSDSSRVCCSIDDCTNRTEDYCQSRRFEETEKFPNELTSKT